MPLIENVVGNASLRKDQKIPYKIFQTMESRNLPDKMHSMCLKWSNLNPEYDYTFYDRDERIEYINNNTFEDFKFSKERFLEAYNKIKPGAGKADLFRLLIIYDNGGCYFDIDCNCLYPLSSWIDSEDEVVTGLGPGGHFHQYGLVYVPKHIFIKTALEISVDNIINETFINDVRRMSFLCGPPALHLGIEQSLNKKPGFKFKLSKGNKETWCMNGIKFTMFRSNDFGKNVRSKYNDYDKDVKEMNIVYWPDDDIFN